MNIQKEKSLIFSDLVIIFNYCILMIISMLFPDTHSVYTFKLACYIHCGEYEAIC